MVYLLEQHPLAAIYLKQIISHIGELKVLVCPSIPFARQEIKNLNSVLIIDKAHFSSHSTANLHSLKAIFPDAKILILGNPISPDELCRLLFLGIQGFITYDDVSDQLIRAVHVLVEGQLWIRHRVLHRFVNLSADLAHSKAEPEFFTKREWEIVGLLERRLADKQIAGALQITERTVRYHLTQIFDKLGVRDRYSAVELIHAGDSWSADRRSIAPAPMEVLRSQSRVGRNPKL